MYMAKQEVSGVLKHLLYVAVAAPLLLIGMALLKVEGIIREIYPLRRYLVRKNVFDYAPPQKDAIRECSECGYRGVVSIDKHRHAPMSDINWELRCPNCSQTIDGPMLAEDVGSYLNMAQNSDAIGSMVEVGGYAAYRVVTTHNAQYVLSCDKIQELEKVNGSFDEVQQ